MRSYSLGGALLLGTPLHRNTLDPSPVWKLVGVRLRSNETSALVEPYRSKRGLAEDVRQGGGATTLH